MTRSRPEKVAEFNPEPERTFLRSKKKGKHRVESSSTSAKEELLKEKMELNPNDNLGGNGNLENPVGNPPQHAQLVNNARDRQNRPPRTNFDFARPNLLNMTSSIVRPPVQANNFELKPSVIQMVQQNTQFNGLQDEDLNTHIQLFLELCDTFKFNGVSEDAVRLKLFPFSLKGKARQWLTSLPRGSITTWEELLKKFMDKFFPPSKTAKLWADIQSYRQTDSETLYETWDRFKESLHKCPHHGIPEWLQVQIFYNGLNYQTR